MVKKWSRSSREVVEKYEAANPFSAQMRCPKTSSDDLINQPSAIPKTNQRQLSNKGFFCRLRHKKSVYTLLDNVYTDKPHTNLFKYICQITIH